MYRIIYIFTVKPCTVGWGFYLEYIFDEIYISYDDQRTFSLRKRSYINNEVAQFRKFWKKSSESSNNFSYKNTLTIIFTFYCIRKRIPATKNAQILFAFVRPTSIFLVLQNLEFDPESSYLSKKSLLKRSRFEAQKNSSMTMSTLSIISNTTWTK